MPIDYTLPLAVKAPRIDFDPIRTLGQVMALRHARAQERAQEQRNAEESERRQLQNQARVRAASDEAAIRQAFVEAKGDPAKAMDILRSGPHGSAAVKLDGLIQKQVTDRAKQRVEQLKALDATLSMMGRVAGGIHDEDSFQAARVLAEKVDPGGETSARMGDHFDPVRIEEIRRQGLKRHEQVQADLGAARELAEQPKTAALWSTIAARNLATSTDQPDRDSKFQHLRAIGVPDPILEQFTRTYSPTVVKQDANRLITGAESGRLRQGDESLALRRAEFAWRKTHPGADPGEATLRFEYTNARDDWNKNQPSPAAISRSQEMAGSDKTGATQPLQRKSFQSYEDWKAERIGKPKGGAVAPDYSGEPSDEIVAAGKPARGKASTPAPSDAEPSVVGLLGDTGVKLSTGATVTFKSKPIRDAFISRLSPKTKPGPETPAAPLGRPAPSRTGISVPAMSQPAGTGLEPDLSGLDENPDETPDENADDEP